MSAGTCWGAARTRPRRSKPGRRDGSHSVPRMRPQPGREVSRNRRRESLGRGERGVGLPQSVGNGVPELKTCCGPTRTPNPCPATFSEKEIMGDGRTGSLLCPAHRSGWGERGSAVGSQGSAPGAEFLPGRGGENSCRATTPITGRGAALARRSARPEPRRAWRGRGTAGPGRGRATGRGPSGWRGPCGSRPR